MQWDTRQKNLLLILARDVASKIATPMFVVDADGRLVFYNEAAEGVLGMTFADAGEMSPEEWSSAFSPMDAEGRPVGLKELPLGIALLEGRPTHKTLRIRGADGVERDLAITGLPLLAHRDDVVGAVALFWNEPPAEEGS